MVQTLREIYPSRVDVTEFYDPANEGQGIGKSMVIYGEEHMDRSP